MPRETVGKALQDYQEEQGIRRNCGKIYVESDRSSEHEFQKVISHFVVIYDVSRTVAEIRLNRLGYLIDRRNRDLKRIDDLFRNE